MYLCVVSIFSRMNKYIPFALILSNIMTKQCHNHFVVLLYLPVGLGANRNCRKLLCAKVRAQSCEQLLGELGTIICHRIFAIPCEMIQSIRHVYETAVDVICSLEIAFKRLEYLSVITTTYSFSSPVLGREPGISIARNSNRSVAGNN